MNLNCLRALVVALAVLWAVPAAALPITYSSTDVPRAIPDNTTIDSVLNILDDLVILDLNVTLTLTHTFDSDLQIRLFSPVGTFVTLSQNQGAAGDNFSGTVFDDEAAVAIAAGSAPFAGSFRPDGLLSSFDGQSTVGTWRLNIADQVFGDQGNLAAWSITVDAVPAQTAVPEPASMLLLGAGLAALAARRVRRARV